MMRNRCKTVVTLGLAFVLCAAMSFTPIGAVDVYGASNDGLAYEDFEGKKVDELKKDSDTKAYAEDPELYRYYDVDKKGKLREKEVELDEVDKFIQEMDKNAEGITDTRIAAMNDDMTAVGCGVSGLGKAETPSKYKNFKRHNCIDISWWQGDISKKSWEKVRAAGVKNVFIRTSYTSLSSFKLNPDSKFKQNLERAYDAGIKVGVYHFSQALSEKEAKKEANYVLNIIADYKDKIKLPVVLDYETNSAGRLNMKKLKSLSSQGLTPKICMAFCEKIKEAGYKQMIYANYTMLTKYMDYKTLQKKYRIWLANYTTNGKATTYEGEFWAWQYSSSGKVNGLKGSIDINYIFSNGQGGSKVRTITDTSGTTTKKTTTTTKKPTTTTTTKATTTTTTAAASPDVLYRAKVTADSLNYRTGPGVSYKKKGEYKEGDKVNVVGISGSWSKLDTGYYVYSYYLKKLKYPYKAVTTCEVNYRTGPGVSYTKIGTYKKGKKITIVSSKNGWAKMDNGYYLYKDYTKKL